VMNGLLILLVYVVGVHEFGPWRGALLGSVVYLLMPYHPSRKS
jgi:hypothetical protein